MVRASLGLLAYSHGGPLAPRRLQYEGPDQHFGSMKGKKGARAVGRVELRATSKSLRREDRAVVSANGSTRRNGGAYGMLESSARGSGCLGVKISREAAYLNQNSRREPGPQEFAVSEDRSAATLAPWKRN